MFSPEGQRTCCSVCKLFLCCHHSKTPWLYKPAKKKNTFNSRKYTYNPLVLLKSLFQLCTKKVAVFFSFHFFNQSLHCFVHALVSGITVFNSSCYVGYILDKPPVCHRAYTTFNILLNKFFFLLLKKEKKKKKKC